MRRPPTRRIGLVAGMLAAALSVGGCASRTLDVRREMPYPASPARTGVLDIQLIVGTRVVTLTNTTTRTFEGVTLWLNAWYGARIDRLEPGQTLRVPFGAFADEHGGGIAGGGFWATERAETIVLAEIQQGDSFYGVVVVTPRDRTG